MSKRVSSTTISRDRQSGIALLAVLWAVLALGFLSQSVLSLGRSTTGMATTLVESVSANLEAEAGVETAIFALLGQSARSAGQWSADNSLYGWRSGETDVFARASLETGKVDINAASEELLARIIGGAGIDADPNRVAAAIADYRDEDSEPRPYGAEDSAYFSSGRLLGAKDAPFNSVDELLNVAGITGSLFDQVSPGLTVFSGRSSPDARAASDVVRAALVGGPKPVDDAWPEDVEADQLALGQVPSLQRQGSGGVSQGSMFRIEAKAYLKSGQIAGLERIVFLVPGSVRPYTILDQRRLMETPTKL